MGHLFNLILIYPLLNLLVFFYHYIPDLGIVIILLTVIIRLLLLPLFHKQLKSQQAMNQLQPKMEALKLKHKDDKEAHAKAVMQLYAEHKINPLGSCLPLLIQFPLLIAIYQVFRVALSGHQLVGLYPFVSSPGAINPYFLHFINLTVASLPLAIAAGVLQYVQGRLMLPKAKVEDPSVRMMQWQTVYFLPAVTVFLGSKFTIGSAHIGVGLPAGLMLYWIITTLFGIVQQYYILRKEIQIVEGVK